MRPSELMIQVHWMSFRFNIPHETSWVLGEEDIAMDKVQEVQLGFLFLFAAGFVDGDSMKSA